MIIKLKKIEDPSKCVDVNVSVDKMTTFKNSFLEIDQSGTFNCGRECSFINAKITIRKNGSLVIGSHSSIRGRLIVEEESNVTIGNGLTCAFFDIKIHANEGASISIGNDCLFSNVEIYNSDMHSIFDVATGSRINNAKDVKIEDRVWLAADVKVLKGSVISSDTVVGSRAIVAGRYPPGVILSGNPAVVTRNGIRWTRPLLKKMPISFPDGFSLAKFRGWATALDHAAVIKAGVPVVLRYEECDMSNYFVFYYTARAIYEVYFRGNNEINIEISNYIFTREILSNILIHAFNVSARKNYPCGTYAYVTAVESGRVELAGGAI